MNLPRPFLPIAQAMELCVHAGAQYMMGSESKDFGSPSAPRKERPKPWGTLFILKLRIRGKRLTLSAPPLPTISKMDFIKDIDNPKNSESLASGAVWTLEYGGR